MEMVYLTAREIRDRLPGIKSRQLSCWSKQCHFLGRALKSKPHPTRRNNRLYLLADAERVSAVRGIEPLAEEFTDPEGRWIWILSAARKPYGIARGTLARWKRVGCEAIGGNKLKIKTRHSPGGSRQYVRSEDLDTVMRWRLAARPSLSDIHWMSFEEARHHLSPTVLAKYSDSKDSRRKMAGKAHPVLGHTIKTVLRKEAKAGKTCTKVYFWSADILKLVAMTKHRDWATWREAQDEYNLQHSLVRVAVRQGKVEMKKFPAAPSRGRPVMQQHFYRPHLEAMAIQSVAKASLPTAKEIEDRSSADAVGTWLPTAEAERRVGVHSGYFTIWRKKCPHLDGKPFRAKKIKPTWKSSRGKIWVYNEADADQIHRKINNLPEPVAAQPGEKTKPKKVKANRGRPRADQTVAEFNYRIAREWKTAQERGQKMEAFGAQTRDVDSKFLGKKGVRRILQWVERNPKKTS